MIFDPLRHRMILFASTEGDTTQPALWEFSTGTGTWSPLAVAGSPPRNGHLLYDSMSDRLIVVRDDSDTQAHVAFVPLAGTLAWTHVIASGPVPYGFGCAPIFDAPRHRVIAFGGINQSGPAATYALDLSAPTPAWSVIPLTGAPPRRFDGASIYDPVRDRMILFGGTDGFTGAYQDLWQLNLSGSPVWSQLVPGGGLPPARYSAGSVYDSRRDRMILFSGHDWGTSYFTDTWAISLAGAPLTTELTAAVGPSPPRQFLSHAFDPDEDRVLLFGGYFNGGANDTYELSFGDIVTRVTVAPAGSGDVTQDPNIACPDSGATVTFTAQPAVGYAFSHWSGDASGSMNPLSVVIRNQDIVAHFTGYTVTATTDPPGTGSVSQSPDQATYAPGSTVTLTATPSGNSAFSYWSGDASGTANPLQILVDSDKSVIAHFEPGPPVIARFSPTIAPVGRSVTIFGMGFSGASAVDFNGVLATFGSVTDGQISTAVPPGATDGPIHVTTPRGTAISPANFRVGDPPPPGINLSWDRCGTFGAAVKTFACTTGVGPPFQLFGSFVPPAGIDEFLGMSAQIDIRSAEATLPDWWKHGPGQCRDRTGLSVAFAFPYGSVSCTDFYQGAAFGGYAYDVAFFSPNRARLRIQCAVPIENRGRVEPGTEYYAFAVNLTRTGTDACAGCSQPMCVVLNEIQLFQPLEPGNDPQLVQPYERNFVSWQSAPPNCPLSTATDATVIASEAEPGQVRIVWLAPLVHSATVERRTAQGAWTRAAELVPDGDHRLTYEDTSVAPGVTYGYRLAIADRGESRSVGETSVTVPAAAKLALSGVNWRPNGRAGIVNLSLPHRGAASVAIFDAAGRRLMRHEWGELEPGRHEIEIAAPLPLASGVYFARLIQGRDSVRLRFVVVR